MPKRAKFPRAERKGEEINRRIRRLVTRPHDNAWFLATVAEDEKYGATVRFHRIFGRGDGDRTHDLSVPNAARYQLRYASIFSIFIYFRKWSNMWSSHLFRTFFRKVYRPNCQCCQGVQRFEQIYQGKPLWVSRTYHATKCVTLDTF